MNPNSPPRGLPLPLEWGPVDLAGNTFANAVQTTTFIRLIRNRLDCPFTYEPAIQTLFARYLVLNLHPQETDPFHHAEMLDLLNVYGQQILGMDERRVQCAHQAIHYALTVVATMNSLENDRRGVTSRERRNTERIVVDDRELMHAIVERAASILARFGLLDHDPWARAAFGNGEVGERADWDEDPVIVIRRDERDETGQIRHGIERREGPGRAGQDELEEIELEFSEGQQDDRVVADLQEEDTESEEE